MADSGVINLLCCLWTFQNLSIASLFVFKALKLPLKVFISCNMVTALLRKRTFQHLLLLFFEFIFVNVWSIKFHQFKGFASVLGKLCPPLAYATLLSAGIRWRKRTLTYYCLECLHFPQLLCYSSLVSQTENIESKLELLLYRWLILFLITTFLTRSKAIL